MEFLQRKLGPFPVWAWGVLLGGLAIAWLYLSDAGILSPAEDTSGEPAGEGAYGSDFSTVPIVPEETETDAPEATNLEWLTQAVNAATGSGIATAVEAQTALSKYLEGAQLTAAEGRILNEVLGLIGLPPQGTETPNVSPDEPEATGKDRVRVTISAPNRVKHRRLYRVNIKLTRLSNASERGNAQGRVELYRNGKLWKTPWVNGAREIATTAWFAGTKGKQRTIQYSAKYLGRGDALPATSNMIVVQVVK